MPEPLDVQAVAESVRAMVREMGRENYRYTPPDATCLYDRDAYGSGAGHRCVIGEWIARHGADMAAVAEWETPIVDNMTGDTSVRNMYSGGMGPGSWANLPAVSGGAVEWLSRVQHAQDKGESWGAAVTLAAIDDLIGE